MPDKSEMRQTLVSRYNFAPFQVDLGLRAGFKCEYCGKDMLESVENYMEWQVEHIIPQSKEGRVDFTSDNDNLALSCKTCNFFKRAYLPEGLEGKSRVEQVKFYRGYIMEKRAAKEKEVREIRGVVGR